MIWYGFSVNPGSAWLLAVQELHYKSATLLIFGAVSSGSGAKPRKQAASRQMVEVSSRPGSVPLGRIVQNGFGFGGDFVVEVAVDPVEREFFQL